MASWVDKHHPRRFRSSIRSQWSALAPGYRLDQSAGVVNQHIQPAELALRGRHHRLNAGQSGVAVAAPLVLRPGDVDRPRELTRSSSAAAGHVQRARMVLLAAEGLPNAETARRVGMTRQTVIAWRARCAAGGIDALADLPRSGCPPVIDEARWSWPRSTHRRARWVSHTGRRGCWPII